MSKVEPVDELAKKLRKHRPLLLAIEAIGWLHMTGKAKADFLREHGGQSGSYDYKKWHEQEEPPFPWDDLLKWVKDEFNHGNNCWPGTLSDFLSKHTEQNSGMLGLLQAGHAMASGIEKQSYSDITVKYLGQDATHMWLSTAFGYPVQNLLANPPELLTETGWKRLLEQIQELLTELRQLGCGTSANDIEAWWRWRESAIGRDGWLRKAFSRTLAETRLPNNDVTLFDQSYVAAALFKSAAAGAVLEGESFPWNDDNNDDNLKHLKQQIRWRLLTVGIGADHFEARAVKIGDWTGARLAIDEFFTKVRKLIEVDLAMGSLLYADGLVHVFSFPGERVKHQGDYLQIDKWEKWLTDQIDKHAVEASFEIPPYCSISKTPSRALVLMTREIRKARDTMVVPLHRSWIISGENVSDGHVCPVCLVRKNDDKTDKQKPCNPCKKRRTHRLDMWLEGKLGSDTIWIEELADANDRVALITMSLDIEPWLEGTRLDSFRAQAISEWRRFNPGLKGKPNPIDSCRCFDSLCQYIENKLAIFDKNDPVLSTLSSGFSKEPDFHPKGATNEELWKSFYFKIVEDRVEITEKGAAAPTWDKLDDNGRAKRAKWVAHQLFRKLASPGRIYRFQRQAQEFFEERLDDFRELASRNPNRWRTRRLVVKPGNGSSETWKDRQVYNAYCGDAPLSLLYRRESKDFLTISNLARLLRPEQSRDNLKGFELELKSDDSAESKQLLVQSVEDKVGQLGVYQPVIPLELSPARFRVLVPLEAASACVDRVVEAWNEEFACVWDHLPLRIGVVAFPRTMPFQAVIEMARSMEQEFCHITKPEVWRVAEYHIEKGVAALSLVRPDGRHELRAIPVRLPDGRDDVFYTYFAVEDRQARFPLDFQHPSGQTYRHVSDLRCGDMIYVYPAQITTVFMDSAARSLGTVKKWGLMEWKRMRDIWILLENTAPSQSALRGAWSFLVQKREEWRSPEGCWIADGEKAWLDLARTVFCDRLGLGGACLDALVEASRDGTLDWSLEWHINVLKQRIGVDRS